MKAGKKDGWRKEGRKECGKEERDKVGWEDSRKKRGMEEGRNEGRNEGRKEGRKDGRKCNVNLLALLVGNP